MCWISIIRIFLHLDSLVRYHLIMGDLELSEPMHRSICPIILHAPSQVQLFFIPTTSVQTFPIFSSRKAHRERYEVLRS